MIILDTNVLSALMQKHPDTAVVHWLDQQSAADVWITSITLFEARYGLALLPEGERKRDLQQRLDSLIRIDLNQRVLAFDNLATEHTAELAAQRKARGRPVDMRDTFIAGIALAHNATVATRNIRHFDDLAVPVIDPWAGA